MISVIVAIARNRAIGFENRLLYRLPDDLRRFKALTTGHTIIMGRKTFESFPKGALPNRRNIVLSRNKAAVFPGAETFSSLQEALSHCKEEEEIFIIGGESVYKEALPLAQKLYLTEIEDTPQQADAFFPPFDIRLWELIQSSRHDRDEKLNAPFPSKIIRERATITPCHSVSNEESYKITRYLKRSEKEVVRLPDMTTSFPFSPLFFFLHFYIHILRAPLLILYLRNRHLPVNGLMKRNNGFGALQAQRL